MIQVDYEKCSISGDLKGNFPDKNLTEAAVRKYLRIVASSLDRGDRPFVFRDRTNEAEARRGKY